MKNKLKRIFCVLLAFAMIATLSPITFSYADSDDVVVITEEAHKQGQEPLAIIDEGEIEQEAGQENPRGEKRFLLRGAQDAEALFALLPAVGDACAEQIVGVPVALEGAGHPQAVDVHEAVSIDGVPCVLRGDVLDEAFAALGALEEDQAFFKAIGQPCFLRGDLRVPVVRDGAADVLPLEVVFRHAYVTHRAPPRIRRCTDTTIGLAQTRCPPNPGRQHRYRQLRKEETCSI